MRALPLLSLVLCGCGLTTHVRPVPWGALQGEAAVGGPMAVDGVAIPLPLSTVGARYGLDPRIDIGAHLHLTSLLALGTPGLDVETNLLALEQFGAVPTVSFTARAYAFTNLRSLRLDAEVGITSSWKLSEQWLVFANVVRHQEYLSTGSWSLSAGGRLSLGTAGLQAELRWFDVLQSTAGASVPWISPFGRGALGVVIGADYELLRTAR